jgi:hypothetical protein
MEAGNLLQLQRMELVPLRVARNSLHHLNILQQGLTWIWTKRYQRQLNQFVPGKIDCIVP